MTSWKVRWCVCIRGIDNVHILTCTYMYVHIGGTCECCWYNPHLAEPEQLRLNSPLNLSFTELILNSRIAYIQTQMPLTPQVHYVQRQVAPTTSEAFPTSRLRGARWWAKQWNLLCFRFTFTFTYVTAAHGWCCCYSQLVVALPVMRERYHCVQPVDWQSMPLSKYHLIVTLLSSSIASE